MRNNSAFVDLEGTKKNQLLMKKREGKNSLLVNPERREKEKAKKATCGGAGGHEKERQIAHLCYSGEEK